jgi:hypothetical protein
MVTDLGCAFDSVTTKEIPKRELRVYRGQRARVVSAGGLQQKKSQKGN